ncbi:hypothetical protein F5878DRAFT_665978 [Lentinula raphanica]|uniref:Retrovirus-related Pol polyprotein from transposon TNT 1-94-like beta-barrel domain-containing protein n=1 Tax=Lentinula raphanica TaxID=153919 RepID=A0AA38NYN6_9AGAR|nr:hypothetical protein F5878DRAFT_665978 [Lentinula raphanica]
MQFNTIFLDSFPRNPTWLVATGNLMGEKSFNVIVSRLDEFYLHMGGSPSGIPANSGDRVAALQAEVDELKIALAANTSQRRGPANPNLICTNPNCKGKGHTIENCWKLGGGKQGQYPKWWKGKRDAPLLNPSANTTTTSSTPSGGVQSGQIYALSATTYAAVNRPIYPSGLARTFADSGATAHFFYDRAVFRNYVPKTGTVGNSSKKGVSFEIVGQGDVDVRVIHKNVVHTLTFRNALHAPTIASNLVSISVLDSLGWTMSVGKGHMIFNNPAGKEVFTGRLVDGLYLMEGSFVGSNPTALTARSLTSPRNRVYHL